MDLIVIHNPQSGAGTWSKQRVERLLLDAGHTVRITSRKRKWQDLMAETPDAFVAAGGDGTVHKVIHAVTGRNLPIAILPTGTANNVAHALGYKTGDDLLQRIMEWPKKEKTLQLARAEHGREHQLFVEAAGVGAFADMVSKAVEIENREAAATALLKIRRKLVQKLLAAKPMQITAKIDGAPISGEYLLLECLNLPLYGPRLRLAPNEAADAPQVTLCGVDAAAVDAAAEWMSTGEGDPQIWTLGRGISVEIMANKAAHVDGTMWPSDKTHGAPLYIHAGVQTERIWV